LAISNTQTLQFRCISEPVNQEKPCWNIRSPNTTIVHAIQANLVTTISNANSGAFASILVPDLANKSVNAFVLPVDQKLREDDCVGSMLHSNGVNNKVEVKIKRTSSSQKRPQLCTASHCKQNLIDQILSQAGTPLLLTLTCAAPPIQYF
jgi:hypothetical protein